MMTSEPPSQWEMYIYMRITSYPSARAGNGTLLECVPKHHHDFEIHAYRIICSIRHKFGRIRDSYSTRFHARFRLG